MKQIEITLTDEQFEKYRNLSHSDLDEFVEEKLGNNIVMGYGYYGCSEIQNKDDKHIVYANIGDNCD